MTVDAGEPTETEGAGEADPSAAEASSPPSRLPVGVWAVAVASGLAAAFAGTHPVGTRVSDIVVSALFGFLVVLLASRSEPVPLLLGPALGLALGSTPGRAASAAALVGWAVAMRRRPFPPWAAAAIAAVSVQVALRYPEAYAERFSALVAAVALVPMAISGFLALRAEQGPSGPTARAARVAAVALGVVVLLAVASSLVAQWAMSSARGNAVAGLESAQEGSQSEAVAHLQDSADRFHLARAVAGGWLTWPSRQVPGVAQQLAAIHTVADTGSRATDLALDGADEIDISRLKMRNGRFDLEAIDDYAAVLARTRAGLHELRRNPPARSSWLAPPVRSGLDSFEATLAKADRSAATGAEAARLAPSVLGADEPRHYFVAFVTPAEARASGGFMGNYSVLTLDDGRMRLGKIGRGIDLNLTGDRRNKHIDSPADYVERYTAFKPAQYWQNITMSPDWPSVGEAIAQLYPQSGGVHLDGVIRLDPVALRHLMAVTGPVEVPGLDEPLGEENVTKYLLRDQYITFADDKAARKEVLGDVGRALFDKLTSGQGADPSELAEAMSAPIRDQNFAVWLADQRSQRFVERIDADAGLEARGGDAFGITNQNAGASKIDTFLYRSIAYHADVDARTGQATATATVDLKNRAPSKGLPPYVIGNLVDLPFGTNRSLLSIYSALPAVSATVDGKPIEIRHQSEQGLNVFSTYVDIGPGKTSRLVVRFAGGLDLASGTYRFDYVPQVQTNPDQVRWSATIDGADVTPTGTAGRIDPPTLEDGTATLRVDPSVGPWTVELEAAVSAKG